MEPLLRDGVASGPGGARSKRLSVFSYPGVKLLLHGLCSNTTVKSLDLKVSLLRGCGPACTPRTLRAALKS